VPSAVCWSIASRNTMAGTMITPPPTPARPETTPAARPTASAITMSKGKAGPAAALPGEPEKSIWKPVTSSSTPKMRASTTPGNRSAHLAPSVAPATPPNPSASPTGTSIAAPVAKPAIPASAMTKIVAREMAFALCRAKPIQTRAGTMTTPPPTPRRPERAPVAMPMGSSAHCGLVIPIVVIAVSGLSEPADRTAVDPHDGTRHESRPSRTEERHHVGQLLSVPEAPERDLGFVPAADLDGIDAFLLGRPGFEASIGAGVELSGNHHVDQHLGGQFESE